MTGGTRPIFMRGPLALVTAALLMAACGGGGIDPGVGSLPPNAGPEPAVAPVSSEPGDGPAPSPERVEPLPAPITGEVPDDLLAPVLEDATNRSGIAIGELVVVRSEFVEWPDGSLGCPEPGVLYTQAIIPGYRVEIEADGLILDYRLDDTGRFRPCTGFGPPFGARDPGDGP